MIIPNLRPGFTLIEMLVVIAMIGLLAAVILVATGSARSSAADAAMKEGLNSARQQAELFAAANNGVYTNVCTATQANNGLASILAGALSSSGQSAGVVNTTAATANQWNNITCHENGNSWAVQAPYRASTSAAPSFWCVDSLGISKTTATALGGSVFACP